jgi:nucleoside-diphosphate-sugar epimerase
MRVLPYIGDPDGKLTLIHGEDCARGIALCLTADIPSGRGYDLDDGAIYSRADLAEGLENAMQKKAWVSFPLPNALVYAVAGLSQAYGRVANKAVMVKPEKIDELLQTWVGDSEPARKELGFKPQITWRDGAASTAQWYKANGWI